VFLRRACASDVGRQSRLAGAGPIDPRGAGKHQSFVRYSGRPGLPQDAGRAPAVGLHSRGAAMNGPIHSPSVLRKEDTRLLSGQACFTDDIHLDGMLHGVFIRSPMAHAKILRVDASAAMEAGAVLVLTGADLPFADRN